MPAIGIAIGLNYGSAQGAAGPYILLSANNVPEDASIGDAVGTLSVVGATGTPTFTLEDDAGGLFVLDGAVLKVAGALDYTAATSHQIIVSVSGVTPAVTNRGFDIFILDVEQSITLTALTVSEAASSGTAVGTFGVTGAVGTPTFTLEDDAEGLFSLDGDVLEVVGVLDYEIATAHEIEVSVSGVTPSVANRFLIITVTNAVPVLTSADGHATSSTTADISVDTTEDSGTLFWVLTTSPTGPSAAQVKAGLNHLGAAASASGSQAVGSSGTQPASASGLSISTTYYPHFMHEEPHGAQSIVASDASGFETTAIILSASAVLETASVGANVGTLSVVGATGTPTFVLVDSAGGKFAIDGTALEVNAALDYEAAISHQIEVSVSGTTPAIPNRIFTISVTNVLPTLSNADGVETSDASADLSVDTTEDTGTLYVVVTTSSTSPTATQVRSGLNHLGAAATFAGSQPVIATGTQEISATGLTPDTHYYPHFMHEESLGTQSSVATFVTGFTTEESDASPPVISTLFPVDGATEVALDVVPTVLFNEGVAFGTGSIDIYLSSDDSLFESFDVVADVGTSVGQVTVSAPLLTIRPSANLAASTAYYVQIDATAIDDLAGNSFAGITNKTTWNFNTGLPAVTLEWISDENDPYPVFEWVTDLGIVEATDKEVYEFSLASDFAVVFYTYEDAISSQEITDQGGTTSGFEDLPNDLVYARLRIVTSGDVPKTAWSNTESKTLTGGATLPYLDFSIATNSMYAPAAV